jgi:ribosomal protein L37AE/L43A
MNNSIEAIFDRLYKMKNKQLTADAKILNGHIYSLEQRIRSFEEAQRQNKKRKEPDKNAPKCPKCNSLMVERVNYTTGEHFWGCSDFPICRGSRSLNFETASKHTYNKYVGGSSEMSDADAHELDDVYGFDCSYGTND